MVTEHCIIGPPPTEVFPLIVFFDIDGTLLDHETAARNAKKEWRESEGSITGLSGDEFNKLFEDAIAEVMKGGGSFDDNGTAIMQALYKKLGRTISPENARQEFEKYMGLYLTELTAYDDAMLCLSQISVLPLGIISNGDSKIQQAKLRKIDILHLFSTIVTSVEEGVQKPDKEIFLSACKKAETTADQAFYVGDDLELDARAAKAAGMDAILVDRKGVHQGAEGITVISSLQELPALLMSMHKSRR